MTIPVKKRFVILCYPRTGSYHLVDKLNQQHGVTCHGELFKPNWVEIDKKYLPLINYKQADVAKRDKDPIRFYNEVCAHSEGEWVGFKMFSGHNQSMMTHLLDSKDILKVFLTRNPIQSHISLLFAKKTGKWTKTNEASDGTEKITVAVEEINLINHYLWKKNFYEKIKIISKLTNQSIFFIDYNYINDLDKLKNLSSYFTIHEWRNDKVSKYKKQINRSYQKIVENYNIIEKFCAKFDVDLQMDFYQFTERMDRKIKN